MTTPQHYFQSNYDSVNTLVGKAFSVFVLLVDPEFHSLTSIDGYGKFHQTIYPIKNLNELIDDLQFHTHDSSNQQLVSYKLC